MSARAEPGTRQEALRLQAEGRLRAAESLLAAHLTLAPDDAACWVVLAGVRLEDERWDAALAAAARAVRLRPDEVDGLLALGDAHAARANPAAARECYRRAVAAAPGRADALARLGEVTIRIGEATAGAALCRRALALAPGEWRAQAALGGLPDGGDASESASLARAAYVEQRRARAATLAGAGEWAAARASLAAALRACPGDASLWLASARLSAALGRDQECLEQVERSLALEPDDVEAIEMARRFSVAGGLYERARDYCQRALARAPSATVEFEGALLVPSIETSWASIAATRARVAEGLARELAKAAPLEAPGADVGGLVVASHPTFYLAYHGLCNRDLQQAQAGVFLKRMPKPSLTAAHCVGRTRRPGRIRVGFVSRFLHAHSIGKTSSGLIAELDRREFECHVLRISPCVDDARSRAIVASADRSLNLSPDPYAARDQIAALELDVLFFQDIGMEPTSYFLAHSRLAPVQCVSYGHPDTTGVPTMDYFISNDLYEVDGAEAHYSEELVTLRGLPTLAYYRRPRASGAPLPREQFGLSQAQTLYLCPQTLFKLHPDFDTLAGGILARDPRGVVVLIDGSFAELRERLQRRFATTIPEVCERIRFVPGLAQEAFMGLLASADVVLDTVHFNGMNSSLEALALARPVVTLPTGLQRGRHTQAMYRAMDIADATAADAADYVAIAVRLGTEPDARHDLSRRIAERNDVLFENRRVVAEFERFFREAHARAEARGASG